MTNSQKTPQTRAKRSALSQQVIYIGIMKKCNIRNLWGAYLFSKVHICNAKIAYFDDIANSEILPYGLHFSEVMIFTKLSKMLMGYICNWLLKCNGAITRVLAYSKSLQDESDRRLISCIGKFFKPLHNIQRLASLARNSSITST